MTGEQLTMSRDWAEGVATPRIASISMTALPSFGMQGGHSPGNVFAIMQKPGACQGILSGEPRNLLVGRLVQALLIWAMMKIRIATLALFSMLIGSTVLSLSARADDAYPLSRRSGLGNSDWRNVGIAGGIPTVNTVYTSFSPGASAAQINAAIQACPSNQVVFLNAGT